MHHVTPLILILSPACTLATWYYCKNIQQESLKNLVQHRNRQTICNAVHSSSQPSTGKKNFAMMNTGKYLPWLLGTIKVFSCFFLSSTNAYLT